MRSKAPHCTLAALFFQSAVFAFTGHLEGNFTQFLKTPERIPFAVFFIITTRIESGGFTGFFKNAPFAKPGILRGFMGFNPPFFMTRSSTGERRFLDIYRG